jgi:hypothetical protein
MQGQNLELLGYTVVSLSANYAILSSTIHTTSQCCLSTVGQVNQNLESIMLGNRHIFFEVE